MVLLMVLLIGLSAPIIRGETNLPTLPEAIQLFQVETMNKLRQTIQDQESVIAKQQARIVYLENDVAGLEETMDMLSVEFTQLRKEYEAKTVEAKEMCDTEKAHLREECDMKILTRRREQALRVKTTKSQRG